MWLRQFGRRSDLCDIEVVDDHMIAGAELAVVRKHVIELVTVENVNNRIGVGGAGGTHGIQPLRRRRVIRRLSRGWPAAVMRGGEAVRPGARRGIEFQYHGTAATRPA